MTILPLMIGWHDYVILKGSFKHKPFNDSMTLMLVVHHCSNFQKTSAFWNIAYQKKIKYCSKCFPGGAVMVWVSQKTRFMTPVSSWKPLKMQALCWLWLWRGARALSTIFPCFKTFSPVWFPFVDPHNAVDTLYFGNCQVTFKNTYRCLQTREYFPLKSLKSVQVKTDGKDETFWSFTEFPIECLMQKCVIIHETKPACPHSLRLHSPSFLGLSKASCF